MQEVTKYNVDDIRKANDEKKQVECLKSTTFGRLFIDSETNKPNRTLAAFVLVGFLTGATICEWYGVTNGWPKVRRVLFLNIYITYGFPIGTIAGTALGFAGYKIFKIFKR